ncbi:sulfur carrier protein ThiS adenylyltransferase ThiF [Williamwhitmania taraxaci]|uniref:Sulfur carrier protein ThiS adenylyltransferase n=1 Tax=Williamwhitmania taraxaci TaxID=1640674 RepID=A0A1G6NAJ4_9BACT|nr:sulfur carrier protein ThiS adenylyltransferase ThiF [Williamwhitmania taraxaci]SDC64306.1 sulfur carrier protein ThiS adenylyltransferase [Williamwhitmania taraxaci]
MPSFTEIKERLHTKCVGIAGAGGLGSNCAVALARSGVGKIIIADFDVIVESNLNRQYYFYDQIGQKKVIALKENIKRIDPNISVEIFSEKITLQNIESIFSTCDILIEAFDQADQKMMLIEYALINLPNIPIIAGSGMAGFGESNSLHVEKFDNLYICGDGATEVSDINPPLAPRVGIVANMQANVALDILLKGEKNGDHC